MVRFGTGLASFRASLARPALMRHPGFSVRNPLPCRYLQVLAPAGSTHSCRLLWRTRDRPAHLCPVACEHGGTSHALPQAPDLLASSSALALDGTSPTEPET